jgi:hypothetical protein
MGKFLNKKVFVEKSQAKRTLDISLCTRNHNVRMYIREMTIPFVQSRIKSLRAPYTLS